MSADIDDIHRKLSEGGLIDATEAIIYAQYHTNELRRAVDSLRGIAALSVADEREACAKIVDEWDKVERQYLDGLADAIRRRANTNN